MNDARFSDIDECQNASTKVSCEQACINTPGSYKCACQPGYTLNPDQRTCSGKKHSSIWVDLIYVNSDSNDIWFREGKKSIVIWSFWSWSTFGSFDYFFCFCKKCNVRFLSVEVKGILFLLYFALIYYFANKYVLFYANVSWF